MSVKVKLKSKVGPAEFKASWGGKDHFFKFTKDNDFTCEVPTKVEYLDSFGEKKQGPDNYAQFLLDHYPDVLELAEVVEEPVVKPAPKQKKGKQNEISQ